jgi:hypothetical protein
MRCASSAETGEGRQQKFEDGAHERSRHLEIGDVRGRQPDRARARNGGPSAPAVIGPRHRDVVIRADDERRVWIRVDRSR